MTVPDGVDYEALDDEPSNLLFMIAAPSDGGDVHLEVLSRLMVILMDEDFRAKLLAAESKEAFLQVIDEMKREKYPDEPQEAPKAAPEADGRIKVLAVTACPTGIAHTYMAAEALEKAGKKLGISIKVETNGSGGAKNILTKEEIEQCDGIIVAADKNVEMARFDGKKVWKTKVSDDIKIPEELIQKIESGDVPVYHHAGGAGESQDSSDNESFGRKMYKHLMNGVSNMLPFTIAGGIFIAIAFLIDTLAGAPQDSNFGTYTAAAAFFKIIGGYAFNFMVPILAGDSKRHGSHCRRLYGRNFRRPRRRNKGSAARKTAKRFGTKTPAARTQGKKNITKDGTEIQIYANIGGVDHIGAVLMNDAGGIGLFRSEFLYLENSDYPTEEQQFLAYKWVLESMAGKKVIIRTLDIGADKQVDYFNLKKEDNPAMGYRAIRICLTRPDIFKTQLRALYRASVYGNLGIMFPMITSVSEVQKVLEICKTVREELQAEQIPYAEKVELGIMIETPAAAIISDQLAPLVDFFSVGTNDLTQYTLACDRQNPDIESFCDTHHEAILRLIAWSAKNAHEHGAWIGICGELAADTSLTERFLRMEIDELSVSPTFVLKVRDAVRKVDLRTKEN